MSSLELLPSSVHVTPSLSLSLSLSTPRTSIHQSDSIVDHHSHSHSHSHSHIDSHSHSCPQFLPNERVHRYLEESRNINQINLTYHNEADRDSFHSTSTKTSNAEVEPTHDDKTLKSAVAVAVVVANSTVMDSSPDAPAPSSHHRSISTCGKLDRWVRQHEFISRCDWGFRMALGVVCGTLIAFYLASPAWEHYLVPVFAMPVMSLVATNRTLGATIRSTCQIFQGGFCASLLCWCLMHMGLGHEHRFTTACVIFGITWIMYYCCNMPLVKKVAGEVIVIVLLLNVSQPRVGFYFPWALFFFKSLGAICAVMFLIFPFPRTARLEVEDRYSACINQIIHAFILIIHSCSVSRTNPIHARLYRGTALKHIIQAHQHLTQLLIRLPEAHLEPRLITWLVSTMSFHNWRHLCSHVVILTPLLASLSSIHAALERKEHVIHIHINNLDNLIDAIQNHYAQLQHIYTGKSIPTSAAGPALLHILEGVVAKFERVAQTGCSCPSPFPSPSSSSSFSSSPTCNISAVQQPRNRHVLQRSCSVPTSLAAKLQQTINDNVVDEEQHISIRVPGNDFNQSTAADLLLPHFLMFHINVICRQLSTLNNEPTSIPTKPPPPQGVSQQQQQPSSIRHHFKHINLNISRHFNRRMLESFKLALAITLACLLPLIPYISSHLSSCIWAPLTIVYLISDHIGGTFFTSALRMTGTAFGSVFGFVCAEFLSDHIPALLFALCVFTIICAHVRAHPLISYAGLVAAFTATFITLGGISSHAPRDYALHRVLNNMIGALILLLVSNLLFPLRATQLIHTELIRSLTLIRDVLNFTSTSSSSSSSSSSKCTSELASCIEKQSTLYKQAKMEPTMWWKPFPAPLYQEAQIILQRIWRLLSSLQHMHQQNEVFTSTHQLLELKTCVHATLSHLIDNMNHTNTDMGVQDLVHLHHVSTSMQSSFLSTLLDGSNIMSQSAFVYVMNRLVHEIVELSQAIHAIIHLDSPPQPHPQVGSSSCTSPRSLI